MTCDVFGGTLNLISQSNTFDGCLFLVTEWSLYDRIPASTDLFIDLLERCCVYFRWRLLLALLCLLFPSHSPRPQERHGYDWLRWGVVDCLLPLDVARSGHITPTSPHTLRWLQLLKCKKKLASDMISLRVGSGCWLPNAFSFFLSHPFVRPWSQSKKFVNMLCYKPLSGISANLQLWCSWGQRWTGV